MADYNPAVALNINAPDPQGGLTTLSKIMGLGQQGLAIRGAQSENITKAAQATIANQSAGENQNLAKLMSDPVGNGIVDQDGNPTKDAQKIVMQAAPTTGMDHYEKIVSAANTKVKFNSAINDLRTSERSELANAASGVATRAESPDEVTGALDNLVESKKGTPEYDNYQTIAGTMKQAITHLATKTKGNNPPEEVKEPWRQGALNMAASILPASSTVGPGGLANPQAATTGAGSVNRSQVTGGLTAPPGAAPGSQINPTPTQVAAATTTAAGTAAGDNERNAQISNSVAPSRTSIALADQVAKLSDEVRTGKFSKIVTDYAATVGQEDKALAARQLLGKYAAQLKTQGISNAPSDNARGQIEAGLPDPDTMSPEAIKGAAEYVKGSMLMNLSRAANARKFQETHGNTQGLRNADDQLTSNADPLMYTYQNLKPGADRQEFIKRHFTKPEDALDFVRRKNAVEHYGGFAQ